MGKLDVVTGTLESRYIYPEKINFRQMIFDGFVNIERKIPDFIISRDLKKLEYKISLCKEEKKFAMPSEKDKISLLNFVENVFKYTFLKTCFSPEEKSTLMDLFISGFLKSLDPHTKYLESDGFKDLSIKTAGTFGGVGIKVSFKNYILTVEEVIPDSPADRAGILENDIIISINSLPSNNMNLKQIVGILRGRPGSEISLNIQREQNLFTILLKRDVVKIATVESKLIADTGYIKIKRFQKKLSAEVKEIIEKMLQTTQNKLKGVIFDMRENPGGLLDEAILLSDMFLSKEEIVSIVIDKSHEKNLIKALESSYAFPLIIIQNSNSASASEIFSSAIKQNGRGLIIGERSFGKGTIQKILKLTKTSALKITTSEFFGPFDYQIQSVGIEPDLTVSEILPDFLSGGSNIFSQKEIRREKLLKNSIKKNIISAYMQKNVINYLKTGEEKDIFVELALKIMEILPDKVKVSNFLNEYYIEQMEKLFKLLEGLKVDWNILDNGAETEPELEVKFNNRIKKNEDWSVTITVKNKSSKPLSRYRVLFESRENYFVREFIFGVIKGGEKVQRNFTIQPPKDLILGQYNFEIFHEDIYHEKKVTRHCKIFIYDDDEPLFSYRLKYKGNEGNGFFLTMKNEGNLPINKFKISMKSEDVDTLFFIKPVFEEWQVLRSGESRDYFFEITKGRFFWKGVVKVSVGFNFSDNFFYNVSQAIDLEKRNFEQKKYTFPILALESLRISSGSDNNNLLGNLFIKDTDNISYLNIFNNGKKFYFSSKNQIDFSLPLEEGKNIIEFSTLDLDGFSNSLRYAVVN